MAYCDDLDDALRNLDWAASATSMPTTSQATELWGAEYASLHAAITAAGITVGTGQDLEVAQRAEALATSVACGSIADMQRAGEVTPYIEYLRTQAREAREQATDPTFMEALGATVDDDGRLMPRSLATDYPAADLDMADVESPTPTWTQDQDL